MSEQEKPQEQEPLMWSTRAQEAIDTLTRQIQRLIAHHNDTHDEALHVDRAMLDLRMPSFAVTMRCDVSASGAEESQ